MRAPELRLKDILEASEIIRQFVEEVESFENFDRSVLYQSAIIFQMVVIGEAASHLDDAFRGKHPEVPWNNLKHFRNFAVHQYFGVDYREVWNSAQRVLSEIEDLVIRAMRKDFPDL